MVSTHRNMRYYVGEQDAEELEQCLLNEKTRNVQQLIVEDFRKTDDLLEILMGQSVPPRREYLLKHGEEANVD